jgi:hypothetical protein
MRITKKFTGDLAIGKRVFSRMLPTAENEATIAESQKLLAELEAAWLAKLEEMRLEAERKAKRGSLGKDIFGYGLLPQPANPKDAATIDWVRVAREAIHGNASLGEVERLLKEGESLCGDYDVTWQAPLPSGDGPSSSLSSSSSSLSSSSPAVASSSSSSSSYSYSYSRSSSSSSSSSSSFSSSFSSSSFSSSSSSPAAAFSAQRPSFAQRHGRADSSHDPSAAINYVHATPWASGGSLVGYAAASGGAAKRMRPDHSERRKKANSPPLSPTDHAAGGLLLGFIDTLRRKSLDVPVMPPM